MSRQTTQKSHELFRHITAGLLSAMMFTSSVLTNYAGLSGNIPLSVIGEDSGGIGKTSGVFTVKEAAANLEYQIELKADAQWKVIFSGSGEIPDGILEAEDFKDYRENIDEVVIGGGITGIAAHAFEGLPGLHIVTFEDGNTVTTIGESAFRDCPYLEIINLENCKNLTTLGIKSTDTSSVDGVFSNSGLKSIILPASLETIGKDTFCDCTELVKVEFEDGCMVNYFGLKAFANCTALESINLEACAADSITFVATATNNGVFFRCKSLKEITIPSGASGNINNMFEESSSLSKITFESNENNITSIARIVYNTSVDVLDLTPLTGLKKIDSWQVRGDKITTVRLPAVLAELGQQVMGDMPSLSVVEFDENTSLTVLGAQTFQHDSNLISVNLEALHNLQTIASQAFDACSGLTTLTFPVTLTKIEQEAFNGCGGLVELNYNAANLSTVGSNIFNGAGVFDLVIGTDVQSIPVEFLSQAQDHIAGIKFETAVTFDVVGDTTGVRAPFTTSGTYTADENGNIYKVENDGAKLVYANKNAETLYIPAKINGFDVTGVAKDAFKNCNVKSLEFEKIENITTLEDYAFANAMLLETINDETIDENIKKMFSQSIDFSNLNNIFYNTQIKNEAGSKIGEENIFPSGAVKYSLGQNRGIEIWRDSAGTIVEPDSSGNMMTLNYNVSTGNTIQQGEDGDRTDRVGKYWWTGKVAMVNFGYQGGRPIRIYIRAEDNCVINFNNQEVHPEETDVPGVYYYDVVFENNETANNSVSITYPNLSAPGSKIQLWAVEFNEKNIYDLSYAGNNKMVAYPGDGNTEDYTIPNEYFELEWTTRPVDFTLEKNVVSNADPSFIIASDNQITLDSLKYQFEFKKSDLETKDVTVGSDYVRYVDYTDTLTLPADKLKWRDGIYQSITEGRTHFIKNQATSTLYIEIGGVEYELFTLSNASNLVDMSIKPIDSGNNYELCWRLVNPNTTDEVPTFSGYLSIGSEVLVATADITAGTEISGIINDVRTDEYFTFSEVQVDEARAVNKTFIVPAGKITMDKELLNKADHMGEDLIYKITIENSSIFDYLDITSLKDDLNPDGKNLHYIKPENMQSLFKEQEYGEYLTITITDAVLAKELTQRTNVKTIVSDIDETIRAQNSADWPNQKYDGLEETDESLTHRNVKITLKATGDGNVELSYTGTKLETNSADSDTRIISIDDLTAALEGIGYIVTTQDKYSLEWTYPEEFSFPANTKKEIIINTSIKDSLMYLPENDHDYYYEYPNRTRTFEMWNSATLYTTGNEKSINDNTSTHKQTVSMDLEIKKNGEIDGEALDMHAFREEDVIDYSIKVMHYGTGSYDVLPVVDHMWGRQAVIVTVEDNQDAEWVTSMNPPIFEKDGVEYYVLNQPGTYEGVYTNEFYADSIVVEDRSDGKNTIIKYYIQDTPGRTFDVNITYKAVTSQTLAGNDSTQVQYSISNEAWFNDRPGHRIHDVIGSHGSTVVFDKYILIEGDEDDPKNEELAKFSSIKRKENTVTYRLELRNTNGYRLNGDGTDYEEIGDTIIINYDDIFDQLPLTGDAFKWEYGVNIDKEICYRVVENEGIDQATAQPATAKVIYNGDTIVGDNNVFMAKSDGSEWNLTNTSPSVLDSSGSSDPADQRYIVWNEGFQIILPAMSTVYMYVTLHFPGEDADDNTWDTFLKQKGGDKTLVNTFYLYELPAVVTHTLVDTALALLQKGVYETGTYVLDNTGNLTTQYFSGADRYHYSNTYEGSRLVNTVTYYVILRNSGNTRLYLSPIYDILPPGFEYMSLRVSAGQNSDNTNVGKTDIVNSIPTWYASNGNKDRILAKPIGEGPDADFSKDDDKLVAATVNYAYFDNPQYTTDGDQMLKFEFTDIQKDEKGYAYLDPGEYIHFGYTVYTGDNVITEAVNTIAMQYYDPYDQGALPEQDQDTDILVKDIHGTTPAENNDGEREVWENDEAKKNGFDIPPMGVDENPLWYASSVTVTREKITPGINKQVEDPLIAAGESPKWTVTSYNHASSEISGYTITDTLEAPLKFEGDFSYYLYGPNGSWYTHGDHYDGPGGARNTIFTILRETIDGKEKITVYPNNSKNGKDLTDGAEVELTVMTVCGSDQYKQANGEAKITVQLITDEDGNEVLTIGFPDKRWDMIPNGYSVLEFSTTNTDPNTAGTYRNTAMFSPDDNTYGDNITQGDLVKNPDGTNRGVESEAMVSIYVGSPSTSTKMIKEKKHPENNAASTDTINYIRLLHKGDVFTYTLEVSNPNSEPMENLVIIDNLPEIGDKLTMGIGDNTERNSPFKVNFSETPNVEVILYQDETDTSGTVLGADEYVVGYSDKSNTVDDSEKTNGYSEDDWQYNNTWVSTPDSNTRSIRIKFNIKITSKQIVHVRFDAVIDADDENAVPERIAWNNFGYCYKVGDSGVVSKASPPVVGICIPGSPTISKKVVDYKSESSSVKDDTTFKFIIYKNNTAVEFDDYTADTVGKKLTYEDIPFEYIELPVAAGASESKEETLSEFIQFSYTDDETFKQFDEPLEGTTFWDTTSTYYVVELDAGEDYSSLTVNETGENNYSFKIDPIKNTPLEFVNEKARVLSWELELKKINDDDEPLDGAWFGLYSPNPDDQMGPEELERNGISASYREAVVDQETYYLMDVKTTYNGGLISWTGLDQEEYVVFEINAPAGYYSDGEYHVYKFEDAVNDVQEVTITNKSKWNFQLTKTDQYENPVKGALFGLYTTNEKKKMNDEDFENWKKNWNIAESWKTQSLSDVEYYLMDIQESPEDGIILWEDLDEDKYGCFEIKAPDGYTGSSGRYTITYTMAKKNGGTYKLSIVNTKNTWDIVLTKTDDKTPAKTLQGAVFGLYSETSKDLLTSAQLQDLVKELNQQYPGLNLNVSDSNLRAYGKYLIDIKVSSDDGLVEFKNLDEDTYYVYELQAPVGYSASSNGPIECKKSDAVNLEFTMTVTNKEKGSIKLIKINEDQTEKLEGATFALYSSYVGEGYDPTTFEKLGLNISYSIEDSGKTYYFVKDGMKTSDANGEIKWENLRDSSTYIAVEVEAPAGYTLDNTHHVIPYATAGMNLYELTVVNYPLSSSVELPETGGIGIRVFIITGFSLICVSVFFILRNKRKQA